MNIFLRAPMKALKTLSSLGKQKSVSLIAVFTTALLLSACSEMPSMSSLSFANQDTQPQTPVTTQKTRASSYLYFNRLEQDQQTAYITIINSSNTNTSQFNLKPYIEKAMQDKGYKIVPNSDQANIVIRANLVRIGNFDDEDTQDMRNSEFGNSAIKISLTKPKDIDGPLNYGAIVDLQAYERSRPITPNLAKEQKENTKTKTKSNKKLDTESKNQLLIYSNSMDWDRFQTRIITQELNTELPQEEVLKDLGEQIEQALYEIIQD